MMTMKKAPKKGMMPAGYKDGGKVMKDAAKKAPKKMMMVPAKSMKMADGGMPMVMKDGKKVPAFAADGVGKMAKGGKAHSDMAKDKPMMKKVAATAVKGHEKKMHGMAKGGGIEIKGKTKGTMIKMKKGGSC
jgi:hypothetical protein